MAHNGWIALPRDIEEHWLWLDPRRFQMWLQLVFGAAWEDTFIMVGNVQIPLKRGQIAVSTRSLMRRWGCCSQMATQFLRTLDKSGIIKREFKCKLTVITIVDFDNYQPTFSDKIEAQPKPKKSGNAVRDAQPIKEVKNKEEKNNNTSIPFSKETEQKFFDNAVNDEENIKSLVVLLGLDENQVKEQLNVFLHDNVLRKNAHPDYDDFIKHFKFWCEKRKGKKGGGGATQKQTDNDRTKQSSALRGTEISNKPASRYKNETF